jgi:dTDP-4-dehydrorhamnose reductase
LKPKRILIVGGSGFVGRNLIEFFASREPLTATYLNTEVKAVANLPVTWAKLDARSATNVVRVMDVARPDFIVHAAGNKNVGWCQSHAAEADAVNGEAVANVARACQHIGARMIYLSTDLVFDGRYGGYREKDVPSPATVYGRSKLRGEQWARAQCPDVVICRSGGVYGKRSPLLRWLRTEMRESRIVEAYTDVRNTPTYVMNLAEMMAAVMNLSEAGTFHTCGSQSVTRLELFQAFARAAGLPVELLAPTFGGAARDRMLLQPDTSLNIDATQSALGISFDSVASGMNRFMLDGPEF